MFIRSFCALAALTLLAGCPNEDDVKDLDTETETDAPSDTVVDTPSETEVPTDSETDGTGVPVSEIDSIRLASLDDRLLEGDLVMVREVIVTGVRTGTANDNGFAVQDPTVIINAALFVNIGSDTTVPLVGDIVTVTGRYRENDLGRAGAEVPNETRTELVVVSTDTDASWERVGTGDLPIPAIRSLADVRNASEPFESQVVMLVDERVNPTGLEVATGWGSGDSFEVEDRRSPNGIVSITSDFAALPPLLPSLMVGSVLDRVTGIQFWDGAAHVIAPRGIGDFEGFGPPILDTDETDESERRGQTDASDTDGTDASDASSDTDDSEDSFIPATSDTDPTESDSTAIVQTSLTTIRGGVHSPGQILRIPSAVVTAVRYRQIPPASNGFVVQDPSSNTGIYVFMRDTPQSGLPAVGDDVDITAYYEEWPCPVSGGCTASVPDETLSRLVIPPGDLIANWVRTGAGPAIQPVVLTMADFQDRALLETYESVLVTLDDTMDYDVQSIAAGTPTQSFRVGFGPFGTATEVAWVSGHFYNPADDYSVNNRDTVDSITGVIWYDVGEYRISPATAADVVGYVDNF